MRKDCAVGIVDSELGTFVAGLKHTAPPSMVIVHDEDRDGSFRPAVAPGDSDL